MIYNQLNKFGAVTHRKQDGVVLISCIVFLLLILMLLKISMTSSNISEQKSGIERELGTAREAAQLALRDAEMRIISVVHQSELTSCQGTKEGTPECAKALKTAIELAWIKASSTLPDTITSANPAAQGNMNDYIKSQEGEFDQKSLDAINAAALKIKNHSGFYYTGKANCKNKQFWKCVQWNPGGKNYISMDSSVSSSIAAIAAEAIPGLSSRYDVVPRYIIERFLPGEVDMPADASILFRITAIGFGQSGGSDENVTHAFYQANYVL